MSPIGAVHLCRCCGGTWGLAKKQTRQRAYLVPPPNTPGFCTVSCWISKRIRDMEGWEQFAISLICFSPPTIKWWTDWRLLLTEKCMCKGYCQFSLKEALEVQLPFLSPSPVWLHSFEWPTEEESFSPRAAHWPWSNSPGHRGSSFLYTLPTMSAPAPRASLNAIPGLWGTRNSGTESN